MTTIANILIIILISVGVLFNVVTAFGLVRLPDVYTRTHAASKSSTLGVLAILSGAFIHLWLIEGIFNTQMIIAIAFLFITAPVGGHLIGRAAYLSGIKVAKQTVRDDLGPAVQRKKKRYSLKKPADN